MWKIIIGFAVFAALVFYVLSKGVDIELGCEKHGVDSHETPKKEAPKK